MIISRTPFRISFFGGGTDYPAWYRKYGGAVLASTINKYCYITCRYLPPFFEHRSRIVWSKVEHVKDVEEIQHPAVRESLRFMNIQDGVEIHHDGDLPARSGLGSSSSFTVGVLHTLYALKGVMPGKLRLALDAIEVEQNRLKENVGSQDQISASFGGFNRIDFGPGADYRVTPMILPRERLQMFQDHLMLFFTGFARTASEIAADQVRAMPHKTQELNAMHQMVDEAINILNSDADLTQFGRLLDENWKLKRSLSPRISTPEIDDIYETAIRAGAVGGKLLGAGGGGIILFFVRPEDRPAVLESLKHLLHIPFSFESYGSQIIFYDSTAQAQVDRPAVTVE